jgi:hypothetical protein
MANPTTLARARTDFRVFLWLIWKHLDLPDPTERQYEIAEYLQHGPRRKVIMAFRGIGKIALWLLWNNPELKILVVSASKERSDSFSIFTKRLLGEVAFLQHLAPNPRLGDRDSNIAFDVRGCRPAHAPSVKSVGITGQIAGSRADYIICDDVEVPNNSETATQREKLVVRVAELGGAVLTPMSKDNPHYSNEHGGVTFLGTPQVEDSLYNNLGEKGYDLRIWPAEMPDDLSKYHGRLSPSILDSGLPPGAATDPARFDLPELVERKVEYGTGGYALQFMLDTSIADENIHPLKIRDLVVLDIDVDVAPDYVVWSGAEAYTLEHLPNVGLHGDRFQGPMKTAEDFSPFTDTLLYVDPSGRGKDQTAYAIIKFLNGMIFLYDWGAFDGGYSTMTLTKLASLARDAKCNMIVVENNFGDGMYEQLLQPIVDKVVKFRRKDGERVTGCQVEGHRVKGQKELRAIDCLEPVMSSHRVIIDEGLVKRICTRKDRNNDIDAAFKSGFYQMTRLTKERGCLKFDDWIDAFAGAVGWWTDRLGVAVNKQARERRAERLDEELEKFMEDKIGRSKEPSWTSKMMKETP